MAAALLRVLRLVERDGQRCGGPVLLVGFVLGAGVVPLASGPLGQTSRFSLELQLLLMLAAVGGGLLASPRADLLGEWRDLLSGLRPRCAVFAGRRTRNRWTPAAPLTGPLSCAQGDQSRRQRPGRPVARCTDYLYVEARRSAGSDISVSCIACRASFVDIVPANAAFRTLTQVSTTSGWITLSSIGYRVYPLSFP